MTAGNVCTAWAYQNDSGHASLHGALTLALQIAWCCSAEVVHGAGHLSWPWAVCSLGTGLHGDISTGGPSEKAYSRAARAAPWGRDCHSS